MPKLKESIPDFRWALFNHMNPYKQRIYSSLAEGCDEKRERKDLKCERNCTPIISDFEDKGRGENPKNADAS